MTRITGLGETIPRRIGRKAADTGPAFAVPDPSGEAAAEPDAAGGAAAPQGMAAMLAMQETVLAAGQEHPRRRDQAARKHGQNLLAALSGLQRALLGTSDRAASRAALQALLDGLPAASDPALAAVLRAIALRAHVELARDAG